MCRGREQRVSPRHAYRVEVSTTGDLVNTSAAVSEGAARVRTRRSALRHSELNALLLLGDALAAAAGAWGAPLLWSAFDTDYRPTGTLLLWQAASIFLWPALLRFFGGNDIAAPRFGRRTIAAVGQAGVALIVVMLAIFYFAPYFAPRGSTLVQLPLTIFVCLMWRYTYLVLMRSRVIERRVAIVGTDEAARRAAQALLRAQGGLPYRLVAFLAGDVPESSITNIPVIRVDGDIWSVVKELNVDQLVVGHTQNVPKELLAELVRCFDHGVEATPATVLYEQLTGRVMAPTLEADWYAQLPTHARGPYLFIKRVTDVTLAGLLGIVALPLVLLIALGILIESGRPVIYRQIRVGQWGEYFVLHKFRTMRRDAEADGPRWATKDDERITRLGRFLRRSRLDELPQLWDVVRGKMSLIGPRPEQPEFFERLMAELPLYRARVLVRPGITGWAQVQFPYAGDIEENLAKLEYDLYYIRHLGPALDVSVALRTVVTALGLGGR